MFSPTGRIISLLWSGSWPSIRAPCYCLQTSGLQGHGGKISWGVRSLLNGASQCQQLTNKIKFTRKFFSNLNNYKGAPLDGHWLQLSCKRDQHKPLELWRKVPSSIINNQRLWALWENMDIMRWKILKAIITIFPVLAKQGWSPLDQLARVLRPARLIWLNWTQ